MLKELIQNSGTWGGKKKKKKNIPPCDPPLQSLVLHWCLTPLKDTSLVMPDNVSSSAVQPPIVKSSKVLTTCSWRPFTSFPRILADWYFGAINQSTASCLGYHTLRDGEQKVIGGVAKATCHGGLKQQRLLSWENRRKLTEQFKLDKRKRFINRNGKH